MRISAQISLLFLLGAPGFTPNPANATAYRWVDENGVTVYSQSPPPSGDAVAIQKQPAPSAADAQRARERLRTQLEDAQDKKDDHKRIAAEEKETDQARQQREDSCRAARKNLEGFENLGRRMVKTTDGEYLRLSEDQVAAQISKARNEIEESCR